jgi:AcrR family transcriptional regulator
VTSPTQVDKATRMSAAERREQLLDVTKELVLEHGFHDVSIEAVARAAGVSRPIVYGHFDDLPGLLEALTQRESARALNQLSSVLLRDLDKRDARQELLRGLRAYLEAARSDPGTWRLVLMPPEGAPASLRERIAIGRAAVLAQLAEAVRAGFGPGRESPDPELTAAMLSTFSDESVRLMLTDAERYPVERIVDHARWWLDQLAS